MFKIIEMTIEGDPYPEICEDMRHSQRDMGWNLSF